MLAAIVALVLHTAAVSSLGPTRAAVFPGLVPVVAVGLSIALLGERLNAWIVAGLLVVCLGIPLALGLGVRRGSDGDAAGAGRAG